jgi:hypothetical protein
MKLQFVEKLNIQINDINEGKKKIRGTDEDMRAFGITGKVTSKSKADSKIISNVIIQNDKNTFLSMIIDRVPRQLLYVVDTTELTVDQEILNIKKVRDHNDFGTKEISCSYESIH